MNKIYEEYKFDVGMVAQVIDNSNATGAYFPVAGYRSLIAVINVGAMAKTKTAILQLMQATNALAGSAKVVTVGTCTITAAVSCTHLQVTLATVLNTESIVINDLTFTGHTDTTTLADREFSISGNDTADAVEFCLCVNDPTYGVPGVLAESALGVVQLTSTVPGETLITAVSGDVTLAVVTVEAQAYVEIDPMILDGDGGFDHVAVKITSTATGNVSATMIRGKHVKKITQRVAGSYPV